MIYLVPYETKEHPETQQTFVFSARVHTRGKPKRRAKQFRKWLSRELMVSQHERQTAIIQALGFTDLL